MTPTPELARLADDHLVELGDRAAALLAALVDRTVAPTSTHWLQAGDDRVAHAVAVGKEVEVALTAALAARHRFLGGTA